MTIAPRIRRWEIGAAFAGSIAAVLSLVGFFLNRSQFFHSYLFAWLFWSGLSFGALVVVMMHSLTGGQWGLAVRGISVAAFRTLPLMALLFVPILLGIHHIYRWSNGDLGEAPGYHHKAQYLNVPFFTARAVFFFCIAIGLTLLWRRSSAAGQRHRVVATSAVGLIAYVLCMNFASTDWVMSLDPTWYSTIFVEIFAVGQFLSALAFGTALAAFFGSAAEEAIPTKAFHGLGNMLLAFVIFWTYVAFSQFLIIWSGNLPKEISWYLQRSHGGWQWLALAVFLAQFFIPFALLLSRSAKTQRIRLGWIALFIGAASIVTNFWLVAPSFHPDGFFLHWLDVVELIALGGFWFILFFRFLKREPLLPAEWTERGRYA
jgi:hypothetical protein